MNIFINSEKISINKEVITGLEVIKLSGFPLDKFYLIKDEINSQIYKRSDIISLRNNMSLVIKVMK